MANLVEIILRASGSQQVKRELSSTQKGLAGLEKMAGKLGIALGLAGVAGAFMHFSAQSIKAAARAEQTEIVFNNLSGTSEAAAANLEAMRRATAGLTTDTDAQAIASQLLGMRIVENAADLERVVYASRRLGAAFRGLGARQAAEEFAMMMSNMSVMRLDTFGISSGRVRRRIEELQAATADMTREEAFFIATMEEAEETLARLGEEVIPEAILEQQKLKKATEELKEAWGDLIDEPAAAFLHGVAVAAGAAAAGLDAFSEVDETSAGLGALAAQGALAAVTTDELTAAILKMGEAFDARSVYAVFEELPRESLEAFREELILLSETEEEFLEIQSRLQQLAPDLWLMPREGFAAAREELQAERAAEAEVGQHELRTVDDRYQVPDFGWWSDIPEEALEIWMEFSEQELASRRDHFDEMDWRREEWEALEELKIDDYHTERLRDLVAFQSDMADAEARYYRDRQEMADDHSLEAGRDEEDHQTRLDRLREEYEARQAQAIADRDALAYIRNQREYEAERQRLEQEYQRQVARRDEDFARRLAELDSDFQEEQAARTAHFEESQADLEQAHEARLTELRDEYERERTLAEDEFKIKQKAQKDRFKKEMLAWYDQYGEEGELYGLLRQHLDAEKRLQESFQKDALLSFQGWLGEMGDSISALPLPGDGGGGTVPPGGPDTWPPGRFIGETREWNGQLYLWNGSFWQAGSSVPGYEAGAWEIRRDQIAQLHTGEMIVPAGLAHVMRSDGLPEYQSGAWEIREDQIAKLHAGEMVVPSAPAEAMRANNLAVLAANPPGGMSLSANPPGGISPSFAQTIHLHGLEGATAQEVAGMIDRRTVELLNQFARSY